MTERYKPDDLKARIAQVFAKRESLKKSIDEGSIPACQGLAELEKLDSELSSLDSRFKQMWDHQQQ